MGCFRGFWTPDFGGVSTIWGSLNPLQIWGGHCGESLGEFQGVWPLSLPEIWEDFGGVLGLFRGFWCFLNPPRDLRRGRRPLLPQGAAAGPKWRRVLRGGGSGRGFPPYDVTPSILPSPNMAVRALFPRQREPRSYWWIHFPPLPFGHAPVRAALTQNGASRLSLSAHAPPSSDQSEAAVLAGTPLLRLSPALLPLSPQAGRHDGGGDPAAAAAAPRPEGSGEAGKGFFGELVTSRRRP